MMIRNDPPPRTSSEASALTTSPGHIHSRSPSGSVQASYTISRGAGILRRTTIRCLPSAVFSMYGFPLGCFEFPRDIGLQRVHTLLPELPVVVQPPVRFAQGTMFDPATVF